MGCGDIISPFTCSDVLSKSIPKTVDASQMYVAVSKGLVSVIIKLPSVKFPDIVLEMRYLVLFESRDKFIPSCLDHCKLGGENPKAMQVKLAACGWVTAGSRGRSEKIGKTGEKKGQNELFIKLPQLVYMSYTFRTLTYYNKFKQCRIVACIVFGKTRIISSVVPSRVLDGYILSNFEKK